MERTKDVGYFGLGLGVEDIAVRESRSWEESYRREGFRAVTRQHGVIESDDQADGDPSYEVWQHFG